MPDIADILERYRDALLEQQGVTGVGLGRHPESGEICIKIFVASPENTTHSDLPTEIENVPVDIVHTGEIRPL